MSGDQLNHHSSAAAEPGAWQFGNQGIQMADSLYPNIWNHPNTNKRTKNNQDIELDQAPQASQFPAEIPKVDTKDGAKQDYIHLRARRGQATNSHSLAERVRRERISERMKYLQELVPGCCKVTGKAVMLDEIINYVQSLQRQVEFLSMKLAAVNPSIDLNVDGLLSKDVSDVSMRLNIFLALLSSNVDSTHFGQIELHGTILPSRMILLPHVGPPVGFSPDIIHPQLLPLQHGLAQAGISGMVNHMDALRRAVNAQFAAMNGFKEPTSQTSNPWEAELQNMDQMNFGDNHPPSTQEFNGKPHNVFQL